MRDIDHTVEALNRLIAEEALPKGKRLPPERSLAARFGVSRAHVRHALAQLEAEGRVWRHIGKGTFVGGPPVEEHAQAADLTRATNPGEIMEARLAIEPRLAAIAALAATAEDLARMRRCLEKGMSVHDTATFELWDSALHRVIAEATHNKVLISVFNLINALRDAKLWGQLKQASVTPDRRNCYLRQHEQIVQCVEQRLAQQAVEAMREHLQTVRQDLFSTLPPEGR